MNSNKKSNTWILIKSSKKRKNAPSEIRIDKNGKVFLDGEMYDEKASKYKNLSVSIEKHDKINTGEETQRMIEEQKKTKRGDTVVLKDVKDPNKTETTTVKF